MNALQSVSSVNIRPTKVRIGHGLGTLLASIGIPMLISAITGKGAPQMGRPRSLPNNQEGGEFNPMYQPPPFIGSWSPIPGAGLKKNDKKGKKGQGLLFGKNSPFNSIPIIGQIL